VDLETREGVDMTLIDNRVKGTDTDTGSDTGSDAPVNGDELVRQGAIKQIQRRRHFHI